MTKTFAKYFCWSWSKAIWFKATTGCWTSFVYGIAPLHGNAIILDHQAASSSLTEMTLQHRNKKVISLTCFCVVTQVQPEICSRQDNQCHHQVYHGSHQEYLEQSRWVVVTTLAGDYLCFHVTTKIITLCTSPKLVTMTTFSFQWINWVRNLKWTMKHILFASQHR